MSILKYESSSFSFHLQQCLFLLLLTLLATVVAVKVLEMFVVTIIIICKYHFFISAFDKETIYTMRMLYHARIN